VKDYAVSEQGTIKTAATQNLIARGVCPRFPVHPVGAKLFNLSMEERPADPELRSADWNPSNWY
jgi:hypothetical protein